MCVYICAHKHTHTHYTASLSLFLSLQTNTCRLGGYAYIAQTRSNVIRYLMFRHWSNKRRKNSNEWTKARARLCVYVWFTSDLQVNSIPRCHTYNGYISQHVCLLRVIRKILSTVKSYLIRNSIWSFWYIQSCDREVHMYKIEIIYELWEIGFENVINVPNMLPN